MTQQSEFKGVAHKSSIPSEDWERPKAQPNLSSKLRDSIAYEPSETGSSDEDDATGNDSESSEGESSEGSESEGNSSVAPTPKAVTTIDYAENLAKNSQKSSKKPLAKEDTL